MVISSRKSYILEGNAHQLIPCVSVVVLQLFRPDDKLKPERYCFSPQESHLNFCEGDDGEVLEHIIRHFSQPGNMTLDLTGLKGKQIFSNMFGLFLGVTLLVMYLFYYSNTTIT